MTRRRSIELSADASRLPHTAVCFSTNRRGDPADKGKSMWEEKTDQKFYKNFKR
ncbi:hypothetical protein HMPREF3213_02008 [Heyndrickxia coagulans]|uniref:Uncharacterized protein n=1 Tax=Heyndrickxia coagulans TaxID=1398 RepID=A0A133KPA2_HEYCO|nr:hypothetical protein HMPREF3213_02008 [Heyndrickxia coagulans]